METHARLLRVIALFEDLSKEELAHLARLCSISRYDKHVQIIGQEDRTDDVFFVLEGSVRISSYSPSGREITYNDVGLGGLFGEFAAVDGLPRSSSVVTLSTCVVARMTAPEFTALLQSNGRVAFRLLEVLVAKLRAMSERVFDVSALGLRERVRKELLQLATGGASTRGGLLIKPAPTHYEIASRIGSHREAVSREFSRLESEGIVEVRRREIRILDLVRLERLGD
ncbi:Crp/Fnr family transcriptional regulator [Vineibacter terrae]|uniref:Crp/Fnr family transcriptional regulator n=1 Tax=Vineibacter terrae TaxID=2586908 RepID=A0A5C8PUB0_9HYPH|nr:Crp/Fnr family transcriptional regulator [Vineibacter terrae]TXL80428.1 Crp/Fnr family transcriptional regulator [Vineibacter terrae]